MTTALEKAGKDEQASEQVDAARGVLSRLDRRRDAYSLALLLAGSSIVDHPGLTAPWSGLVHKTAA